MTSPARIRAVLSRHGLRPKKRLGQNFLTDANVLDAIVLKSGLSANELALEIGPGLGDLTERLARAAKRVIAIEKDPELIPPLKERLSGADNVTLINMDALAADIPALIKSEGFEKARVVANIPYYATSGILFRLLDARAFLTSASVMTQAEVAARVCSPPGSKVYGQLSVAVGYYARPSVIARVPRGCFHPPPDVDSAVIRLDFYGEPPVKARDEQLFFAVVKAAFATRRKTLANCLYEGVGADKRLTAAALESFGLPGDARGEALSIERFARLSDTIADSLAKNGRT